MFEWFTESSVGRFTLAVICGYIIASMARSATREEVKGEIQKELEKREGDKHPSD
ncbi:hypothetical protein Pan241w_11620 [Gimesia alba]|uniref:Uncharacterized protein n=1 Tax=Gimesia alba TaxID=2527973 RepID=A0A517RBB1_9PLAN|nr:hypothetical protein [Gimesia alba]QDT41103.1 hypothetical protein Pan241w_11620 [Gimesia alba]